MPAFVKFLVVRRTSVRWLLGALLLGAGVGPVWAQDGVLRPSVTATAANPVRVMSGKSTGIGVGTLLGREVRLADGFDVGQIRDLAVDAYSGHATHLVVESQGELRLAPLPPVGQMRGSTIGLSLTPEAWAKTPTITAAEFETGWWTLTGGERRELATELDQPTPPSGSHLVRLSALRGKRISSAAVVLGRIADLQLEADEPRPLVVIVRERQTGGDEVSYGVLLDQLNLAARGSEPIPSRLTPRDFEQARR